MPLARLRHASWLALVLLSLTASAATPPSQPGVVTFRSWSPALFAEARAQHRFVLLDLGAVWCHWCHVMEETTYRDPSVARLIASRFIAVRADQDADPELSRRYEDWGWPATIVFAPDGSELVKRRGYMPPEQMTSLLRAILDDPTPGPSVRPEVVWAPAQSTTLGAVERQQLEAQLVALYDQEHGGWGNIHKLLDAEPLEYAMSEPRHEKMARQTLDAALALIDPVWGGMYQYSDEVDWHSPHYEKLISVQAQAIELYARAWQRWRDPRYLAAARAIADYTVTHLSDGEAFFTSQDADVDEKLPGKDFYGLKDAGRRALHREPPVDQHIYPRENGWMVAALVTLAAAAHEPRYLERALLATKWIDMRRRRPNGGYVHGEKDPGGPYLGDSLAMALAEARLATVDQSWPWLKRAHRTLDFIHKAFADPAGGYDSAVPAKQGIFRRAVRQVDENATLARLARDLGRADIQAQCMKLLASPTLPEARSFSPAVLLLDQPLVAHDKLTTNPK